VLNDRREILLNSDLGVCERILPLSSFRMSAADMKRSPPSGIAMLIVGGGMAGMTLAIESHRKGHNVRLIERRPNFDGLGISHTHPFTNESDTLKGDIFGLSSSAFQSLMKWPGFLERMRSKALHPVLHFYKYDGSWIIDTPKPAITNREPGFTLSRAHAHDVGCSKPFSVSSSHV